MGFLHNLHWLPSAQVLAFHTTPAFNDAVKKGWESIHQTLTKKKSDDGELEIPRKVI